MKHYFSEKQNVAFTVKKFLAQVQGMQLEFYTAPGVFSKSRVDKGTKLLVTAMQLNQGDKVLDMGCGIGIVGIVAAKRFNAQVLMVDINERAIDLAKRNVKLNNVAAEVRKSNVYENISETFDTILVNPPLKAGKKVCYAIIEQSIQHLTNRGTLQLVALHNKGGSTLAGRMKAVFGNVQAIAKQSGYRVYLSRKA